MSKTRNKNHSEVEHLRGENKRLRSENKRLKRQLRELEKHSHNETIKEEIPEEILKFEYCQNCGKGIWQETIIGRFVFIKCTVCDYKQRKKT